MSTILKIRHQYHRAGYMFKDYNIWIVQYVPLQFLRQQKYSIPSPPRLFPPPHVPSCFTFLHVKIHIAKKK